MNGAKVLEGAGLVESQGKGVALPQHFAVPESRPGALRARRARMGRGIAIRPGYLGAHRDYELLQDETFDVGPYVGT